MYFSNSIITKISRHSRYKWQRFIDLNRSSYIRDSHPKSSTQFFNKPDLKLINDWEMSLCKLSKNYIAHNFDILGSGWKHVCYGMPCDGLNGIYKGNGEQINNFNYGLHLANRVNKANRVNSSKIRSFIDKGYKPIDWQLDFKSGFRWPENKWYRKIQYRNINGVDAKVPWELARMQHFPTLALAFGLATAKRSSFQQKDIYASEFCNQLLDFISANPPRYGINWCCTMDVAIRAANILVSYDLFRAYGYHFDKNFENIFWTSIIEHGRHVISNLERTGNSRNNHYLANVVGLLFISAYLSHSSESNSWLSFAINSFIEEIQFQFFEEGTNFERSTSYHRLSTEMAVYGTALVLALPEERLKTLPPNNLINNGKIDFPNWFIKRLLLMAQFSLQTQSPAGRAIQIGDNDSGRFIKFFRTINIISSSDAKKDHPNLANYCPPPGMTDYLMEDNLDHRHLCAGMSALFASSFLTDLTEENHPETDIIRKLISGNTLSETPPHSEFKTFHSTACQEKNSKDQYFDFMKTWASSDVNTKQNLCLELPDTFVANNIEFIKYSEFGVYIFRSPELYLSLRCGGDINRSPTGHSHNDQLSIELWINGECIIPDPGTFLYTPLPNARTRYRSVKSHFAPQIMNNEPSNLENVLFTLLQKKKAECLYFGKQGFIGRHKGFGPWIWRAICFENKHLTILDRIDSETHSLVPSLEVVAALPHFSPGYGIQNQDDGNIWLRKINKLIKRTDT